MVAIAFRLRSLPSRRASPRSVSRRTKTTDVGSDHPDSKGGLVEGIVYSFRRADKAPTLKYVAPFGGLGFALDGPYPMPGDHSSSKPPTWSAPKVAILVLNWNGWADTIDCLDSLSQISYPNFALVVVDNGSTDNSVIRISEHIRSALGFMPRDPEATSQPLSSLRAGSSILLDGHSVVCRSPIFLLVNQKNLGYAGGNNVGIEFA